MNFTYQLQRSPDGVSSWADIGDGTFSYSPPGNYDISYVLQAADVGDYIRVKVTDDLGTIQYSPVEGPITSAPGTWFINTAWVNKVVPVSPTIDGNNAAYQALMLGKSIWTNGIDPTGAWSATVYYSDGTEPSKGPFALAVPGGSYTFPHFKSSWVPSPGDGHIIIVNPDGSYVETQGVNLTNMTIHSIARGNVLTGDATYTIPDTAPFTTVAPVPDAAGLIRAIEMTNGVIPHVIRCAVPFASSAYVYPAHNSDGGTGGGIPTGKRIWLPRSVDISALSTPQKVVATAMQEYGLLIADSGGSFSIGMESTADGSSYSFSSLTIPSSIVNQLVVLAGNGAML